MAKLISSTGIRHARPYLRGTYSRLADGDPGIATTISKMIQNVEQGPEGARHPEIRGIAIDATRNVPSRDTRGEMQALFNWVKQNIRFRGEFDETLQTPLVVTQEGAGDCDDHASLLAALLRSLGYDVEFATAAVDPESDDFSHVYVRAMDRKTGQWVPMDTTVAQSFVGWEPRSRRVRYWPVNSSPALGKLAGFGRVGDAAQTAEDIAQTFAGAAAYRVQYGAGGPATTTNVNLNGNAILLAGAFFATLVIMGSGKGRGGR